MRTVYTSVRIGKAVIQVEAEYDPYDDTFDCAKAYRLFKGRKIFKSDRFNVYFEDDIYQALIDDIPRFKREAAEDEEARGFDKARDIYGEL